MERLEDNQELRIWKDHIPLRWKYTAGIAGDRFLHTLKQGKLQGSLCKSCKKIFLPPKIYCKDCFIQLEEWRDIPSDSGYLYSYTSRKDETIALVKFDGVEGGLLGKIKFSGKTPKLDSRVRVVFRPKDSRTGSMSDIAYFEEIV